MRGASWSEPTAAATGGAGDAGAAVAALRRAAGGGCVGCGLGDADRIGSNMSYRKKYAPSNLPDAAWSENNCKHLVPWLTSCWKTSSSL